MNDNNKANDNKKINKEEIVYLTSVFRVPSVKCILNNITSVKSTLYPTRGVNSLIDLGWKKLKKQVLMCPEGFFLSSRKFLEFPIFPFTSLLLLFIK